jgi:anion-transporting  ArsA/GET3 family ATPase
MSFTPNTKLVFVSGGGGQGKTTIACSLATHLAVRENLKILLLVNSSATSSNKLFGKERKLDGSMIKIPIQGSRGNLFVRSYSCFDEPYDANISPLNPPLPPPTTTTSESTTTTTTSSSSSTTTSSTPTTPRPSSYGVNFAMAAAHLSEDIREAAHSIPEIAVILRFVSILREAMDDFDHVIVDFLSADHALRFLPMPELLKTQHEQFEAWKGRLSMVLGIVKPIVLGRGTPPVWLQRMQMDMDWGVESTEILQLAMEHSTAVIVTSSEDDGLQDTGLFLERLEKMARFKSKIVIINRWLELGDEFNHHHSTVMTTNTTSGSSNNNNNRTSKRLKSATSPTTTTNNNGSLLQNFLSSIHSRQVRCLLQSQLLSNKFKDGDGNKITMYRAMESYHQNLPATTTSPTMTEENGVARFLHIGENFVVM